MKAYIEALRGEIQRLTAAPEGVLTTVLHELGHTEKQLKNVLYAMKDEGLIWSFRKQQNGLYFDNEARMLEAKKAWSAGATERLRKRWRDKSRAYNGKVREAKIAAGTFQPHAAPKPAVAPAKPKPIPKPHQKPYVAAPVTIRATGRGPAYLPGDPVPTSRTIYTYGKSPTNPTHTTTHAE